jgi:GxxExxY protein
MAQEDGKFGRYEDGSERVIGACIEVHRAMGPGLVESTYEECLAYELGLRGIRFDRQREVPLFYKGNDLACSYRLDLVIDEVLILEIKSVERLLPIHQAQLLTYMRLTNIPAGLLINFNVPTLKDGLRRLTLPQ